MRRRKRERVKYRRGNVHEIVISLILLCVAADIYPSAPGSPALPLPPAEPLSYEQSP